MRKRLVGTDHHNDEAFLDLSIGARLVYLHLLTHPQMTSLGLLRITVGGLADECGLDREACASALDALSTIGRVEFDKRCVALSADYLEEPANPSVVTGWGRIIDLLPNTDLVRRRIYRAVSMVRQRAEQVGADKGAAWLDAIPATMVRLAEEASGGRESGARAPGVRYLDVAAPAAMRAVSVSDTVCDTVPDTLPDTVPETHGETVPSTLAETLPLPLEPADDVASGAPWSESARSPADGALDGVGHGVPHGVRDGVPHGVGDGVPHGVRHPARHGVGHSIFHLPTSNIQIPSSQSRLAGSDARAREADDAWGREGLLHKAAAVVGRQLEVAEIEMVDAWLADGIPILLIESALADGLRSQVHRLRWVDRRLDELVKGHLHQHPELEHDDLDLERSVALSSLANDEISGHLSKSKRQRARAAVRRADSAEQVRTIIDDVLVA